MLSTKEKQIAFIRQGYRSVSETVMAKPFGGGCIVYCLDTDFLKFVFRNIRNTHTLLWDSMQVDTESTAALSQDIRMFENWKVRSGLGFYEYDWGFITPQELLANIL
jgi:hypothetical protein